MPRPRNMWPEQEHSLGALWEMADASCHDVVVLSTSPNAVSSSRLREFSLAVWLHLKGALGILRARRSDAIILTKFKTPLLPLLMLLTFPWAKRVFLVVHHTIQQAVMKPWSRPLLRVAARLGYGLLVFESAEELPDEVAWSVGSMRMIVIPEPGPHSTWWKTGSSVSTMPRRVTVGVLGERRAEKCSDELIRELKRVQAEGEVDLDILVAARNLDHYPQSLLAGVRTLETPDMSSYCAALRSCDVVAINHEESRYRHRTSGVLTDAVVFGCFVVAPDYPLFRRQLAYPARVGETFSNLSSLGDALAGVLELRALGTDPFSEHRRRRLPATLAAEFDSQLESLR
ncbi:MAG: hypothetical protein KJP22_00730 [Acidimicrobiia bacterium]|nr:hypothetical protein [Acidimicrobiia bacterium]